MGLEFFIIGFFAVVGLGVSGWFAYAWSSRESDRDSLERSWRSYATTHALKLEPSSGEWPQRRSVSMEIASPRATVIVDTVSLGERMHTRVRATPEDVLLGKMRVESGPRHPTSDPAFLTADPNFDTAFTVISAPSVIAQRILSTELRRKLLAFRMGKHVTFTYERGTLALVWERVEINHARLDEAIALMDAALGSVHAAYEAPSQSRIEAKGSPVAAKRKLRVVR